MVLRLNNRIAPFLNVHSEVSQCLFVQMNRSNPQAECCLDSMLTAKRLLTRLFFSE